MEDLSTQLTQEDLRLEFLAVRLQKVNPDATLRILPLGLFKRDFHRDVERIDVRPSRKDGGDVSMCINREGLYDILPEGVFHRTQGKSPEANTQESIKTLEAHRLEEKNARQFCLPFEQGIYQHLIRLEEIMQQYWEVGASQAVWQIFREFWQPDILPVDQAAQHQILALLPYLHKIAGNRNLTEQVITLLLSVPVQLQEIEFQPAYKNPYSTLLGEGFLNEDVFVGDTYPSDCTILKLLICPETDEDLTEFAPGGTGWQWIDIIEHYLIPIDTALTVEVRPNPEHKQFILDGDRTKKSILDFTTIL